MSPKRNCHEATHYLSCRQFSGSTFGRLVSKWKNYFNYCTALNYSLWKKWWQVCSRAITFPLPLASLSLLMKKPLHTTQSERDRERRVFVHQFSNLLQWWRISIKLKKNKKNPTTVQGQLELQGVQLYQNLETKIRTKRENTFQTAKN